MSLFHILLRAMRDIPAVTSRGNFDLETIEKMDGNTMVLSTALFSDYLLPFELTSFLLLVEIIAVVAIAKRNKKDGGKRSLEGSSG